MKCEYCEGPVVPYDCGKEYCYCNLMAHITCEPSEGGDNKTPQAIGVSKARAADTENTANES